MSELTFREFSPDEVAETKAQFKRFIDGEVIQKMMHRPPAFIEKTLDIRKGFTGEAQR